MTTFWTYDNLARVTAGTWRVAPADGGAMLPAATRALALDDDFRGPVLWHDTRELQPGQCYHAIHGDNFDGHAFVNQAFEQGASLAIVNRNSTTQPTTTRPGKRGGEHATAPATHPPSAIRHPPSPRPILEVEDTVKALQDLARAYRDELTSGGCKVVGVAGSNGKTTTRHLIHHVLTHAGKAGTQSPKSFNNHLGVPLTLLAALPGDDFVACEIGTNHPGEIDFLSAIARPDIAVITSIGEEHLEFFGDIEGVADEESDILKHITQDGLAVTAGPQESSGRQLLWHHHHKCADSVRVIRVNAYGNTEGLGFEESAERALISEATLAWRYCVVYPDRKPTLSESKFRFWHMEVGDVHDAPVLTTSLPGFYNCFNASYAVLVAEQFAIPIEDAAKALRSASLPDQRMNIRVVGEETQSITLIDDAYNANPDSMRAAIRTMASLGKQRSVRPVVVLGDMYELGEASRSKHIEIGEQLRSLDGDYIGERRASIGMVVLVGPMMQLAAEPIRVAWTNSGRGRLHCCPQWTDDLPDQVAALLQPGDTVLLKASRGMRLERLIPAIEKRFGKAETPQPVNDA